ncbi:DUF4113 domain-containing protein [Xanthocytophaga agilis]|uniref:DUF4113 domain-containing protein n=1 Tax=Xanthocytophaga agilis TaxID=3048010 RepID=A0AAE3RBS8_9BACT|nr:DUF4113 domain-containing protein [Xanthocytophaga agilis]MDJ1505249.1 DUF4113 domain-containing protein [Xanthocytophaga agilis]
MQAVDKVNNKMGRDTVRVASQGFPKKGTPWLLKRDYLSSCYTTRWDQLWTIRI